MNLIYVLCFKLLERIYLIFLLSVFLFVLSLQNYLYYQEIKKSLKLVEWTHIFIVSAFYYDVSKSLPNSTIAIIFAARKHLIDFPVKCVSYDEAGFNRTYEIYFEQALTAPVQCKWTIFIAICPVVHKPQVLSLNAGAETSQMVLFKPADKTRRGFMVCMSRMFLFENWQLFLSSIELYKYYGVDVITTYIQSVVEDIYKIMRGYEKDGLLLLRPAVKLFQPTDLDYDPNIHNEWNNQDATYNSCLYEFKDSADFIMIADWDDILIPKHHRNYFDELIWLTQLYPTAAAFIFTRPQATLYTASTPTKFNLAYTIETTQIYWNDLVTGKFIGIPSKFNGTWIHAPTRVKSGHDVIELSTAHSQVYHFRKWVFYEHEKIFNLSTLTEMGNTKMISFSFWNFIHRHKLQRVFNNLPSKFLYYDILSECYRRFILLVTHNSLEECPNVPTCPLPTNVSLSCVNLVQKYTTTHLKPGLIIHHSVEDKLIVSKNGCYK